MAGKIKGITIEINGDTTKLDKALSNVDKSTANVNGELKQVNSLLKFNPGNSEVVAQKQALLAKQIENTSSRLKTLKDAQAQVEKQFQNGDLGEEEYRAFQREVVATEGKLKNYQGQLKQSEASQAALESSTKQLGGYFEASGKDVDDFADVLGPKLTGAIKEGKASSEQLNEAINKIGRTVTNSEDDFDKFKLALKGIDDGGSIDDLRGDLQELSKASDGTADALAGIGEKLDTSNLMDAADTVSGITDKITEMASGALEGAVDVDNAAARINNSFGLTGKEAENTKNIIMDVFNTGVSDSFEEVGEALGQVRQQLKNLDEADLGNITQKAMAFGSTFDADIPETLRGVNALMTSFGVSADEAFDLMTVAAQNGLNKTDELGDNLAEYAGLFESNGYSAQEMFTILQSGLEGGAYNLDRVNDLVKEFGLRVTGGDVRQAVEDIGGAYEKIYDSWAKKGGTTKELFTAISKEIKRNSDDLDTASIAAQIFGTQGEDNGAAVITAMGEASNSVDGVKNAYDKAAGAADGLASANDAQKLQATMNELKTALLPIGQELMQALIPVAKMISDLTKKFNGLSPTVKKVIGVITGVVAGIAVIAPIIASVVSAIGTIVSAVGSALGAIGSAIGAVAAAFGIGLAPLIGIIAAIVAAIVGVIAVIKNWGSIVEWLKGVWATVTEFFSGLWAGIKSVFTTAIEAIVAFVQPAFQTVVAGVQNIWNGLKTFFGTIWNAIKTIFTVVITAIAVIIGTGIEVWKSVITVAMNVIKTVITTVWNAIKGFVLPVVNAIKTAISVAWNAIKSLTSTVWNAIKGVITSVWNGIKTGVTAAVNVVKSIVTSVWNTLKTVTSSVWNGIKSVVTGVWSGIKSGVTSAVNAVKGAVTGAWNTIKSVTSSVWNDIKSAISTPINAAKDIVSRAINAIKGFFNFNISWPHIPMPSFGISPRGWKIGDLLKGSIPHLSVAWHAAGGIMTKPTMFAQNGTTAHIGGEAGPEGVIPLNKETLGAIGRGIAETMSGQSGITINIDQIIGALTPAIARQWANTLSIALNDVQRRAVANGG